MRRSLIGWLMLCLCTSGCSSYTASQMRLVEQARKGVAIWQARETTRDDDVRSTYAAKRKALYPALNDFLLDESFYMAITGNPGKVLTTARLKGMTYRPNDLFMLTEAWLA